MHFLIDSCSQYWTQHPDLFTAITKPEEPAERMLAFVKWYISALNASFSSRVPPGEWEKKPFNPVLGERYKMTWDAVEGSGPTDVFCEQVSHHPPVTGFYIHNDQANMSLNGYTGQKTHFASASMMCDQVGQSLLTLKDREEHYLYTYPSLTVHGIWKAAPYVELAGTSYIQSKTHYATIEYTSRGWVSGEKNHFKCCIYPNGASHKDYLHKIEGQWSGKSTITGPGKHATSEDFLDVKSLKAPSMQIHSEDQGPLETRTLWKPVADAINKGDTNTAGVEKGNIENQKRAERKEREEKGETWEPTYFKWQQDSIVSGLADQLHTETKYKAEHEHWVYVPPSTSS